MLTTEKSICLKANTSFRASYANISDLIYVADTPGAGASNLKQFKWHHIPKGLYPFDLPADFRVQNASVKKARVAHGLR